MTATKVDSSAVPEPPGKEETEEDFVLTDENALDFFLQYSKEVTEDKVRLTTSLGSFTVQLFDNVPYHKANFIYLAKKGYFENTMFHRVVKGFIIQGGNSDRKDTGRKSERQNWKVSIATRCQKRPQASPRSDFHAQ